MNFHSATSNQKLDEEKIDTVHMMKKIRTSDTARLSHFLLPTILSLHSQYPTTETPIMLRFSLVASAFFLIALLQLRTVHGRVCLAEGASLGNCFEINNYDDANVDACEECLANAVYATFPPEDCFAVLNGACGYIAT